MPDIDLRFNDEVVADHSYVPESCACLTRLALESRRCPENTVHWSVDLTFQRTVYMVPKNQKHRLYSTTASIMECQWTLFCKLMSLFNVCTFTPGDTQNR